MSDFLHGLFVYAGIQFAVIATLYGPLLVVAAVVWVIQNRRKS